MKVVLFGATGMIGQGVLRECLLADDVDRVLAIGRTPAGREHVKLREIVHKDLYDLSAFEAELSGYDACFFCLGVSSAGLSEEAYRHITYDLTISAAATLAKANPGITFIYVSGAGTDSTERGRSMWARIKGKTENDLIAMDGLTGYAFRPGAIQPLHGARSRTRWYRLAYIVLRPVLGGARRLFPRQITTTEQIGLAMLRVARSGAPKRILESPDIVELGTAKTPS
jgi:uncharacterized protein YbjT (DUF2867 family)